MNSFHSEMTTQEPASSSLSRSLVLARNLNGKRSVVGWAVGYWQHQHLCVAVFIPAEGGHNRAGTIFLSLVTAFEMLAIPGAIAEDQTRKGFRNTSRVLFSRIRRPQARG
jgi:hypothetical protein